MITWTEGYTAEYYGCYVDPVTGRDLNRFEITGGEVTRMTDELRVNASFEATGFSGEHWIRLYMDARQSGSGAHIPLFTGLTATPQTKLIGTREKMTVACYSPLKVDSDILLPRGWYAPTGIGADSIIKQLLEAPFGLSSEELPALKEAIIAEDGETRLSMTEKILAATGYSMEVTGTGAIRIFKTADDPVDRYGTTNDAIEPEVEVEEDYFAAPNVLLAISDDLTAIARDEDPNSKFSIPTRGREIWIEDTADLNDSETIAEYAQRRLKEEQNITKTITYSRRFNPAITPGSVIEMTYQPIRGKYRVIEQTVKLTYNGRTEEKACEV